MILLKTSRDIEKMRQAGRISARALQIAGKAIEPGITTLEIDQIVRKYIESEGAKCSFLGYGGFTGSACISINEVVVHGIPGKQIVKQGDIVSVDVGAYFNGFHGDNAYTFACGDISKETKDLIDATQQSLYKGIEQAKVGNRIGDIGCAIQRYVEARGYSVVRQFVGHGVGTSLHEDPMVPNYGTSGQGPKLRAGMTIAIEPMINQGVKDVRVLRDGWTTVTKDRKLSAHFEHTIAITQDGPMIMTLPD